MSKSKLRTMLLLVFIAVLFVSHLNFGVYAAEKNGLIREGDYLFFYENGVRYKGGIKTIDGETYYFNKSSGAAQSGYITPQLADGKAYYFDETTFKMRTGLISVSFTSTSNSNVNTYYFLPEGGVHKGFLSIGDKTYYFEPNNGIMLHGTQLIDGKYYQFDSKTGEQIIGVAQADNGQVYLYLPEGGRGESGIVSLDGELYYCLPSQSGAVQFGLQSDTQGNLYFFDYESGKAWRNKTLLLNHIVYTIGSDGIVSDISIEHGYESSVRAKLIKEGLKYLGTPYSLDSNEGFACGYFTKVAYGDVGVQMQAGSDVQCKAIVDGEYGTIIDESELRVGDMIFWTWTDCGENPCTHWQNVHHVGIYMGYGKILEANETFGCTAVLQYHEFDTYYMSHFGRVLFDDEDSFVDERDDALRPYKFNGTYDEASESFNISYDCYVPVDGFEIYRSKNDGDFLLLADVTGDVKSYSDSELDAGSSYTYRVRTKQKNSADAMVYSDYQIEDNLEIEIPDITPPAVRGLTAVSAGKNKVMLSWEEVPGAEGYLVYGKRSSTGKYGYIGMTTKGTTYTDNGALDNDFNFYWVFAYKKHNGKNIVGSCEKYAYAKGVTLAPTGVSAKGAGKGVVQISWNKVDGADGYLIYGRRSKDGKYGYITMTTGATTAKDKGALDNDFNFYWVFPYHLDKNGSRIVGLTPQYVYAKGITGSVTKNGGLAASSLSGEVKISWKAVVDADGYLIYAKRPGTTGFDFVGMTTKNLYYSDKKASKGDWTFYRVFAFHYNDKKKIIAGESGDYVYGKAK